VDKTLLLLNDENIHKLKKYRRRVSWR